MSELESISAALYEVADWLELQGLSVSYLKRRDPREPGRQRKEQAERRLTALLIKRFADQRRALLSVLERFAAMRQSEQLKQLLAALEQSELFEDEQTAAALSKLLRLNAVDGVALFGETAAMGAALELTPAKTKAIAWAAQHAGELIKEIDKTTLDAVRAGLSIYLETPSMSLTELMGMMPFDEKRAETVSVTEVTRAYAEGNHEAGLALQAEFPELVVLKVWHTERDERVCDICEPMDEELAAGGIEGEFKGGDGELYQDPPAHPNCRCWTTIETATGGEGA